MSKYKRHIPTLINWSFWTFLFLIFLWWHGTLQPALSSGEISKYAYELNKRYPEKTVEDYKKLLASDKGSPIFMVNVIKYFDNPVKTKDQNEAMEARKLVKKYNNYVGKFLIQRGSYPVFLGEAIGGTAAAWGVDAEDEGRWSEAAVVRYRNIRTMMELTTDDKFNENLHYKHTALEKTIIYPTKSKLMPGGLGYLVFFVLLSGALTSQLLITAIAKR